MQFQLLTGGLISLLNFGIHALVTGLIVVVTRHIAGRTDDVHVFVRVSALMLVTLVVLTAAHVFEIAVWAVFMQAAEINAPNVTAFEFAFENYTALGYGDVTAGNGWRLIGPIMALNGLLLIGWSVALIFEVLKLGEIQVGRLREK
jgi:Ion channel